MLKKDLKQKSGVYFTYRNLIRKTLPNNIKELKSMKKEEIFLDTKYISKNG